MQHQEDEHAASDGDYITLKAADMKCLYLRSAIATSHFGVDKPLILTLMAAELTIA